MSIFKKLTSFALSLCLSVAAFGSLTVTASAAETEGTMTEFGLLDENGVYHIQTAAHLKNISSASQNASHYVNNYNQVFVLDNDIVLTANDENAVNIASNQSGAVFHGIFDGNGHTISGLTYTTHLIANGLFGRIEGATIKNLVIDRADINTTYTGGIVVGIAENTKMMNISIRNGHIKAIPGNVSLSLFTDGGMLVGALAGQVGANVDTNESSLIYNCESVNTLVETAEAEVGGALGGSGFYLGGLVGSMNNSHIEYCRTLALDNINNGSVKNTTVGIAGVFDFGKVYLGGICGEIRNGATVTDSFSNISMYNEPFTAVSVITATYGYVGGIVGAMYGTETRLTRCHYSGYANSWDFGGLIVPGTDDNQHLGGIAGRASDTGNSGALDKATNLDERMLNCYYHYYRMMENKEYEYAWDNIRPDASAITWVDSTPQIYRDETPETCGSYSEEQYGDQTNSWENNGYDFTGNVMRDTPCSVLFGSEGANHANRWVMHTYNYTNTEDTQYATTTMPVHGKTTAVINSNINNAFVEEPVSMEYQYMVSADNTVMLPDENTVSVINPNLANDGFIGVAFVSEREFEGQNVYTCDMLYQGGTEISADIFETYASDPDKRIYAVWCQAKTLGAQLGLNEENKGFRVLTAVNTDLLDNIGLDLPDDEYGRGATFVKDGNEYFIKADSKEWRGESYYSTETVTDVDNARVFSIFAALQPEEYAAEISYAGDILWNGNNADGTAAVLDFICNMEQTSATELANMYLSDLANAGEIPESVLTEEQFGILVQYIG